MNDGIIYMPEELSLVIIAFLSATGKKQEMEKDYDIIFYAHPGPSFVADR
jgi:hypothetical protein